MQAGSIEGQVVEMGLTTTSLLNVEQFPVLVPNSLFSSQVGCFLCKSYCVFLGNHGRKLCYHRFLSHFVQGLLTSHA